MPITLDGTSGITTPMYNGSITANAVTPSVNMKNRIINGAMVVNQRGGTVTGNDSAYSLDRWKASCVPDGKFTMQQSSTAPVGFINSLLATSTSAYSVASTDFIGIRQDIEGLNCTDLAWGTANAKTITLSFQVQSSLTGTFGGSLFNNAGNRSYPFSYTISSANTWTSISVTIAGDTTGTWLTTNGRGICVFFNLGSGSTNSGTANTWANTFYSAPTGATSVVGTNGATFYITGVQLEVGSTATSFDTRSYTTELQLCQRYLPAFRATAASGVLGFGQAYSTTDTIVSVPFPVTVRTPATGVVVSSVSHFNCWRANTATQNPTSINFNQSSISSGTITPEGGSGLTAGDSTSFFFSNASGFIYFTGCEL